MSHATGIANLIHYGSSQCRRITRSILAAGMHALFLDYDNEFVIRHTLNDFIGHCVKMEAYVYSRSVLDFIETYSKTTEKILQIDKYALLQSYPNGELFRLRRMPGITNPTDALKKSRSVPQHH